MSRSVELGRAVLYLPASNLELWLTTSLTFSPQESADSIEFLKQKRFLDLLSSGQIWVSHGVDMHANLCLTHLGEPFTEQQLDALAQSIITAPVWEQLVLQPSTPDNYIKDVGILRLNLRPAMDGGAQLKKQRYDKTVSFAPIVNTKPPEGTRIVSLDSVHFSMAFLESSQRTRRTNKRQKREPSSSQVLQSDILSPVDEYSQNFDVPLYENDDHGTMPAPGKQTRESPTHSVHSTYRRSQNPHNSSSDARKEVLSSLSHPWPTAPCLDHVAIEQMIGGGFRLSVSGAPSSKSLHGLKFKANTFQLGLADIAPTMWRPGYLHWLSERTRFIPQIGRSLNQIASSGVFSPVSLATLNTADNMCNDVSTKATSIGQGGVDRDRSQFTSVISRRLWAHLAKAPPKWSTTSLQSFVTLHSQAITSSDVGDLFEEVRKNQEQGQEADLQSKENEYMGMSGDDLMLHNASQ